MSEQKVDTIFPPLPEMPAGFHDEAMRAAGLKKLSPVWAKAEIVTGLAAAVGGLKLLMSSGAEALAGGALMVLGLYLAMAGNRSHLYQSMNRQTAFLACLWARGSQDS